MSEMLKKVVVYDKTKVYQTPSGAMRTPEIVFKKYPAVEYFTHIVLTDLNEQMMFAIMNLSAARIEYSVDPSLTDAEAVKAIEVTVNSPAPEPEVSPEERTAAAIELMAMMAMPDMEV